VTDPISRNSQAFEVANFDLSQIENPVFPDRQKWLEKIAMCHWKLSELENGDAWDFIKNCV
jgi:hypothetical protein